jgi:citrate synthase
MMNAELKINERSYPLNIFEGTEGEKSIDISRLRSETGFITLDPGYQW